VLEEIAIEQGLGNRRRVGHDWRPADTKRLSVKQASTYWSTGHCKQQRGANPRILATPKQTTSLVFVGKAAIESQCHSLVAAQCT